LLSIVLLMLWDRSKTLKKSPVPSALVVVVLGVGINMMLRRMGSAGPSSRATCAGAGGAGCPGVPRLSCSSRTSRRFGSPAIFKAAVTIALVATLETLLNLEAVDKIDPDQRQSPPNRELMAQGIGNITAGLIGGPADDERDRALFGEHQLGWQDEAQRHPPWRAAGSVRDHGAAVAE
jgi:MFS superfamily sulfate permease-like transporter